MRHDAVRHETKGNNSVRNEHFSEVSFKFNLAFKLSSVVASRLFPAVCFHKLDFIPFLLIHRVFIF